MVVFQELGHEYGDLSSAARPGTVLSLAGGVMFIWYRTGNGWGDISSPDSEQQLLRGFSPEQLCQFSLALNIVALGLMSERGFYLCESLLSFST